MTGNLGSLLSRDLTTFQLFDWLCVNEEDRETLLAVFDVSHRLAEESFLPHYRQVDIEEPVFEDGAVRIHPAISQALSRYRELGLFGTSFSEELGGLGLPFAISLAVYGNFAAASISTAAYPMLTTANARLIAAFGTPMQVDSFARPQIEGRWFGTMCLSEPQAGSSLGDIRTRALAEGEDELGVRYRLTGNKMWISGGDQDASENIVHLVLAKIVGDDGKLPAGTKGISLFIVPKLLDNGSRNDVVVAGLNHKMGYRGTSHALLNFGEGGGAVGWRVGAAGQGLAQMFMMMNEARISVGMGAAVLAWRGYRLSLRYASERIQGREFGIRGGAAVPIISHPDVRRMLLQQKAYAVGALALCLYCANLVDEDGDEADALLALLTPVAKSWPSEFGLIANDLAIQIHGGYGYTRDFDVEQLWRDNRLNAIHEGTTGIQAMDLLGRKLLLSDGRSLEMLRKRIQASVSKASASSQWTEFGTTLLDYWTAVDGVIEGLRTFDGAAEAYDDASLFLRAFGHGVVAWLWLDQALAGERQSNTALRDGLAYACRFFFESELPQARAWLSVVDGHSSLARTMPPGSFA